MKKRSERISLIFLSAILFGVMSLLSWTSAGRTIATEGNLIVWFFDVGQGDAAFIETPDGFQMLIDGGRGSVLSEKLANVMPYWDRSIDALLVTHPHADHMEGFNDVLETYDVGTVYTTGVAYTSRIYERFQDQLDPEQLVFVTGPTRLDLGAGVTMEIHYPTSSFVGAHVGDLNETSVVSELVYGDTSILFTGDVNKEQELDILGSVRDVDVLKVSHHGSITSSSAPFLEIVMPETAIISVGAGNRYNHPHPAILHRLQEVGATILRTDWHGDIRLTSDGGEPVIRY